MLEILFYILLVLGVIAIMDLLAYIISEQYYKKNPESEKSYRFELLDVVFRHKYIKAIFIAVGIICFAAAIIVFKLYVSPTL